MWWLDDVQQPQNDQDYDERPHPSAPKSLRQIPFAVSDRYDEELGCPLVNQAPQVPLQPTPENGTGDKASRQGSAQVWP